MHVEKIVNSLTQYIVAVLLNLAAHSLSILHAYSIVVHLFILNHLAHITVVVPSLVRPVLHARS